jgi:uncharacterized protein with FMN-binding domain
MTTSRKNRKINAIGASVLLATTALGYTGVNALSHTTTDAEAATTTVEQDTAFPAPPTGRGGRGGDHHLQGMDLNPPTVELAPSQSTTETAQPTDKVEGAAYYDGQYYGDVISAGRWGNMQVVAVVENGELSDVLIAEYPRSTSRSDIITRNALPTLISEAIEAQDANIDFVSRATDSSRAFVASLESALLDASMGIDL